MSYWRPLGDIYSIQQNEAKRYRQKINFYLFFIGWGMEHSTMLMRVRMVSTSRPFVDICIKLLHYLMSTFSISMSVGPTTLHWSRMILKM